MHARGGPALGALGLGGALVSFALPILGVPRMLAWIVLVVGVGFMITGGLWWYQARNPPAATESEADVVWKTAPSTLGDLSGTGRLQQPAPEVTLGVESSYRPEATGNIVLILRYEVDNPRTTDIGNAVLDIALPDSVSEFFHCDRGGSRFSYDEHGVGHLVNPPSERAHREDGLIFRGRTRTPIFFRAALRPDFLPLRLKTRLVSPALAHPIEVAEELVPPSMSAGGVFADALDDIAGDLERLHTEFVQNPSRYSYVVSEANTLTGQANRILRRVDLQRAGEFMKETEYPHDLAAHIGFNVKELRRHAAEIRSEGSGT
jgi:hypothetical protein